MFRTVVITSEELEQLKLLSISEFKEKLRGYGSDVLISSKFLKNYLNMSAGRFRDVLNKSNVKFERVDRVVRISRDDVLCLLEYLGDRVGKKAVAYVIKSGIPKYAIRRYVRKGVFEPSYIDKDGKVWFDDTDIEYLKLNKEMCSKLYSLSRINRETGISYVTLKGMRKAGNIEPYWLGLNGIEYFDYATLKLILEDRKRIRDMLDVKEYSAYMGWDLPIVYRRIRYGSLKPDYVSLSGKSYFDKGKILGYIDMESGPEKLCC